MYLADMERFRVFPNRRGSKNPVSFLFLVSAKSPVLSGLTDRPSPAHHSSTVCTAHSMIPDTVFGNFPTTRRQMPSAYPCAYKLSSLSLTSSSFTTRYHKKGDKTPLSTASGHSETPEDTPDSRSGQPTLDGGTNPM